MKKVLRELRTYSHLLLELVKKDFRKKYYKSVLGVLWTVLNPLMTMLVITFLFSTLFQRNIEHYPVYYLCGWMVFNFNLEATNTGLHSILDNAALLKKIYIPAYLFAISKTLLALINKLFAMIPLLLVMAATGVPLRPTMLLIPLLWVPLFFFSLGISLALASLAVYLRDLLYIYGIVTQLWMYLTPIFYPLSILPEKYHVLWDLNPMFHYVGILRDLALYGSLPSLSTVVYALSWAALAMGLGTALFSRLKKNFFLHI